MDRSSGDRQLTSSFCTFHFLDCFSANHENAAQRVSVLPSIKRETNVLYQQPHLIEPMKLRVYEDLPATPITPELSHLSQWGRNLASRASSRASRMSVKRRTTSKSMISRPQPVPERSDDLPLRRRREFTPLQLSIYVDANRLSDLPEFDRFSFTEDGELKAPPKVLVRTQSEGMLRGHQKMSIETSKRTASMFETGDIAFARPETSYSVVSNSRPPSEHDALHSHPVSWASLPGIGALKPQKADNVVSVLTPMKEEFSPINTPVTVDGTELTFPKAIAPPQQQSTSSAPSLTLEAQAPYPVVSQGPAGVPTRPRQSSLRPYFHNNHQTQKRISQWLHYRTQSSSTSTIGSVSTTTSFAEHRRKRSEFYKLGQQTHIPTTSPPSPPQPLNFSKALPPRQHQRTNTASTSNTVGTSVLSALFDEDIKRNSEESTTTYATAEMKSRTGTIKSLASTSGVKVTITEVLDVLVPPALSGEIADHPDLYLSEIHGPLRSPGVGIAF